MQKTYLKRIIDNELDIRLSAFGAVFLVGPKWCGKTTTASVKAKSILKMQDPDNAETYFTTAMTKPSLLLRGDNPRLIDEWQVAPVLWDAVRTSVDDINRKGLYILTGSTSVDNSKILHTGTGRISRLKMYPMSLYESLESNGKISLIDLFDDNIDIDGIRSDLSIEELIFAACRGGFPASLNEVTDKSKLLVSKDYVNNICESDISTVDGVNRNPVLCREILRTYARNVSTLAKKTTMHRDIVSNVMSLDIKTFDSYINSLEKIYVIDDVEAWSPSIRSASAIRAIKKKEFIDPSIATAAMGVIPEYYYTDIKSFGFIFETLCIRDLKVYSQKFGGRISYYHDRYGLEADAILHLEDGKYALIEFKLGSNEIEKGAEHLNEIVNLIKKHNENRETGHIIEPTFSMIITGGELSYRRKDGIYVIPIGCLKD